jgi:hypothetical protein
MDKKQKLRFNSPNGSFDFRLNKPDTDAEPDSTIIIPKIYTFNDHSDKIDSDTFKSDLIKSDSFKSSTDREIKIKIPSNSQMIEISSSSTFFENSEHFNSQNDLLNFESSIAPGLDAFPTDQPNQLPDQKYLEWIYPKIRMLFFKFYKNIAICIIFVALITFNFRKSSEYQNLINEVSKLKITPFDQIIEVKKENIACLSQKSIVTEYSELYSFGFLRNSVTDPNSMLDPNSIPCALKSDSGFFVVQFKPSSKISKIAFYHPPIGKPGSALKDFSILINQKTFDFQFDGKDYQEFTFDEQIVSELKIIYDSNHGEKKYTCIYRIFIFA